MTLLSPWAFLWLGSIPVLLWIWRMHATRRQIRVPSLVPFAHLVKRPPRRRTHLVVNLLFWLQLAALLSLVLALAQPALPQARARAVLAVLDTSASMAARGLGHSALDRAKRQLGRRIRSKPSQWFIVTTSPIAPVLPQPTNDPDALLRALDGVKASRAGADLGTAARIGRALLAAEADDIVVATDEPKPAHLEARVHWISVGQPLPNAAIAGIDAQGSLCQADASRLIMTVHNFSSEPAAVEVRAAQGGVSLASGSVTIEAKGRRAVSLPIPEGRDGVMALSIESARDALSADNRASVILRRTARPVALRFASAPLAEAVSSWLTACEGLTWSVEGLAESSDETVLITDDAATARAASSSLLFLPPADDQPVVSHWMASPDHPIGAYLASVEVVSAAVNRASDADHAGLPVVVALLNGRRLPIVLAQDSDGHRRVLLRLNPVRTAHSTPILLVFFNSLRWVMSGNEETGQIPIHPSESNLIERHSTWSDLPPPTGPSALSKPMPRPLANLVLMAALLLWGLEWWLYLQKRSRRA